MPSSRTRGLRARTDLPAPLAHWVPRRVMFAICIRRSLRLSDSVCSWCRVACGLAALRFLRDRPGLSPAMVFLTTSCAVFLLFCLDCARFTYRRAFCRCFAMVFLASLRDAEAPASSPVLVI